MSKNTFVLSNKATGKAKADRNSAKDDPNTSRRTISKTNLNQTTMSQRGNITLIGGKSEESKEVEDINKKLSYNEYLESLFAEALVDEKIKREKSEFDVKLAELAKRLEINKLIFRKTQERLKNISFLSEQQRILDETKLHTDKFLEEASKFQTEELLDRLGEYQDMYCDRLLTKNVDLGVKQNGDLEELYSAIVTVNESLENIKENCNLTRSELDILQNVWHDLKDCESAQEHIVNNLKQHGDIEKQVMANVLEVASIELASTLT